MLFQEQYFSLCIRLILEEEMATNFRILAWRILWTGEPGKLLFMGSQRVRRNLATTHSTGRMRTCSESSPEVVSFFGLGNLFIIIFNWFFFFLVQLVYNAVLVSSVQQNESSVYIHISSPFWTSFPFK